MFKKTVAFLLVTAMFFSTATVAFAGAPEWPAPSSNGLSMPFRPDDKYVSQQNPPGFCWQYVPNAKSYNLVVANDKELTDVVYSKSGITTNYYTFDYTFETGKQYFWAVNYVNSSGVQSEYSAPRRFIIDPDAGEFTMEPIDDILAKIPSGHPRLYVNDSNIDEFRNIKNANKTSLAVYNRYVNNADAYIKGYADYEKDPVNTSQNYSLEEPVFESGVNLQTYRSNAVRPAEFARTMGFAYLLTGEEKYAEQTKKNLLAISEWCMTDDGNGNLVYDPNGHTSYKNQDQAHREITFVSAMAYDWIADTLTSDEKAKILNMIKERTVYMATTKALITKIPQSPYDSHGWTAFGFIGIIGLATYGDIPEAESWLKVVIPTYGAICPPWSYQDGGWSQGTDYWQYSTTHGQEFIDALAHSGILNLYDMAWLRNEYLWTLYVYPKGSYGSFGDDSNRDKSEDGIYTTSSLLNRVYFTQDPTTKWLLDEYAKTYTGTVASYITNNNSHIIAKAPDDFPLGHEFEDIGWVTMTDSLSDTNRIQLTFKSSHYGSFNHSHTDQNAFIIQAFGEKLAIQGGYYDAYGTEHDMNFTRKTFTHNTITVDGNGQPNWDFNAKGDILQSVTHRSFDSATGDATKAYKGALDKFTRSIIYVRPDVFVVIDDLDAPGSDNSSFQWWLNSDRQMEYTDSSALISQGEARLKANVMYPSGTKADYYDGFWYYDENGEKVHWPASGAYVNSNEHHRVSFSTPDVASTKMVVTMSVYKADEDENYMTSELTSDGSCLVLTFEDGTKTYVNLTEERVSADNVVFDGDAVTVNEDSIMLTNGTYLEYDGEILVSSVRAVTLAMGHNEISISTMDDSDNYLENRLTVGNNNKFIAVDSVSAIKDYKGREISSEIGLPATTVAEKAILFYPYKDNYILLLNDTGVSLKAEDVRIADTTEKTFKVEWKGKDIYTYDIVINNTVYENVSSPYTVDINENEEIYYIAVRAVSGMSPGRWSEYVYYSPNADAVYSMVKFIEDGTKVTATAYGINEDITKLDFRMVVYGADGNVKEIIPMTARGNVYSATSDATEEDTVKVMLWTKESYIPVTTSATYGANDTAVGNIFVDGKPLDGFSANKYEYNVTIPYGTTVFPVIKASARDNTSKVSVDHDYNNLRTFITVTAPDGESKKTVVNYVLENEGIHLIKGASDEADFVNDSGRKDANGTYSGKVSSQKVVDFSYTIEHNAKYKDESGKVITPSETVTTDFASMLNVYTNVAPNRGGNNFGSRTCDDRAPNSGNHMEFENPAVSLRGYDYIVLPNTNFYSLNDTYGKDPTVASNNKTYSGGTVKNLKVSFTLDSNAEVVVVAASPLENFAKNNGFTEDTLQGSSYSRYMNSITVEDIFYNEYILGKNAADYLTGVTRDTEGNITKALYAINYDKAKELTNVKAISGYSTYKAYRDAYDAGKLTMESFTIDTEPTCANAIIDTEYFIFKNTYVKRFDEVGEDGELVTLNFDPSKGGAVRCVIIVRPITPRKPIENFVFEGPGSFEELPEEYREGHTDSAVRQTLNKYVRTASSFLPVTVTAQSGGRAYVDNNVYFITEINPQLDLEGAYYIPPHRRTDKNVNGTNYMWMRAYYSGVRAMGNYIYPNYPMTPQPWYSFDLNQSSVLYLITSGSKPEFLDDTWQKLSIDGPAFVVGDTDEYRNVYVKQVNVENGSSVRISMKTPSTGTTIDGNYYLFVRPV